MKRLLNLVLFEIRKILNNKKAFLFLLVLNVVPIVASLVLLITYISCRGLGLGDIQFYAMKKVIQTLFTSHFTLFGYISPFFLALIVGDIFSTELGRGYMKMLLITPVKRWQVITSKSLAVIIFLLVAVLLGGIILQTDLIIAKSVTQPSGILPDSVQSQAMDTSISMVTFKSAVQLLVITFIADTMIIGIFIVFSLFFESAILMSFCSLSTIMAIHVLYLTSNILKEFQFVSWFDHLKYICFTRHYTDIFSISIIRDILEGKLNIASDNVLNPLGYCVLWSILFYFLAMFIFSRKQVLH